MYFETWTDFLIEYILSKGEINSRRLFFIYFCSFTAHCCLRTLAVMIVVIVFMSDTGNMKVTVAVQLGYYSSICLEKLRKTALLNG
jgi:hypothetical protein